MAQKNDSGIPAYCAVLEAARILPFADGEGIFRFPSGDDVAADRVGGIICGLVVDPVDTAIGAAKQLLDVVRIEA